MLFFSNVYGKLMLMAQSFPINQWLSVCLKMMGNIQFGAAPWEALCGAQKEVTPLS